MRNPYLLTLSLVMFATCAIASEPFRIRVLCYNILAGDLNAVRDSRVVDEFMEHWQIANERELPTIPATKPTRQVDFILSRPLQRWKTIEVRVLDEAAASDHRPVFAVLELRDD